MFCQPPLGGRHLRKQHRDTLPGFYAIPWNFARNFATGDGRTATFRKISRKVRNFAPDACLSVGRRVTQKGVVWWPTRGINLSSIWGVPNIGWAWAEYGLSWRTYCVAVFMDIRKRNPNRFFFMKLFQVCPLSQRSFRISFRNQLSGSASGRWNCFFQAWTRHQLNFASAESMETSFAYKNWIWRKRLSQNKVIQFVITYLLI